jgi:hypothetical protein
MMHASSINDGQFAGADHFPEETVE